MADAYLYRIDYAVTTNSDWKDAHKLVTGTGEDVEPVDLTGSTWIADFRDEGDDLVEVIEATTGNGRQLVDDEGLLAWNIPHTMLASIGPRVLVYDRIWIRTDGVRVPFATGTLTIQLGKTR